MSRKPQKGYYVKGEFVALGTERDRELKAELKGTTELTRTERKQHSDALQLTGAALLELPASWLRTLELPDTLAQAIAEHKKLTNFEARRRQMQFIGRLMRKLDDEQIEAIEHAITAQSRGASLHHDHLQAAEHWRTRLLADDAALQQWLQLLPAQQRDAAAIQQLRTLIRQARKDEAAAAAPSLPADTLPCVAAPGSAEPVLAPAKSRAYRQLFQHIRTALQSATAPTLAKTPE